ncbi:MAG TPA: HAMP domain-containing sensor histidine kinase [Ruminiclostridium sp.]
MKKIKYKIAIPYMIIIIVIPLITMLIFNIIMRSYILKTSNEDLKDSIEATNYLVKQQVNSNLVSKQSQEKLVTSLPKLRATLKTSKIATKTEIIVLSNQGKLIYPKSFSEDSFLNNNIIDQVKIVEFVKNGNTQQIKVDNKKYLLAKNSTKQLAFKLIYILSMDDANGLIKIINVILISILAIATLVSLFISLLISNSISKPIKKINDIANKIGYGEFVSMEPITSSKEIFELSNSMNSMSQSLHQSENSQRTFLQNASHELRTPLMSVQGYAEGIMKGVFPDNVQAAKIICEESKRLTSLVEQLLVLSRIENNTYTVNMCRTNLNNIMKDYIQRINGLAIKSEKQLTLKEENNQISVSVDEELLSQAVVNIASNSIRFAKNKVDIIIYRDNINAYIKISDDGCGIEKEDLPHIFDRFYKGKGGNFGLGLSIAKSSINAMKGNITVCNTDVGAEFLIKLPIS